MIDGTNYLHVCPTVRHDILGTADPNSINTGPLKKKHILLYHCCSYNIYSERIQISYKIDTYFLTWLFYSFFSSYIFTFIVTLFFNFIRPSLNLLANPLSEEPSKFIFIEKIVSPNFHSFLRILVFIFTNTFYIIFIFNSILQAN